jgi:hypothetical protein
VAIFSWSISRETSIFKTSSSTLFSSECNFLNSFSSAVVFLSLADGFCLEFRSIGWAKGWKYYFCEISLWRLAIYRIKLARGPRGV